MTSMLTEMVNYLKSVVEIVDEFQETGNDRKFWEDMVEMASLAEDLLEDIKDDLIARAVPALESLKAWRKYGK